MTTPLAFPSDPRSLLQALGSRPDASLVHQAQLALSLIDSDLSNRVSSLSSQPPPSEPHLLAQWSVSQEQEVAKAREAADQAKLPYKSIVTLSEVHQSLEDLLHNQDPRTMKTLEVLNSFIQRNHVDQESQTDVASLLLEAARKGSKRLDLSGRLLRSLPAGFGNLANLVSLDLSKNQLKELPGSVGELKNLEILDLQSNQLSHLPDSIGFLAALRILNLSGNMLAALPDTIGGCRSFVEIHAGFNQLEWLPARIGYDLVLLETLVLHTNKLTFLPPSICELNSLTVLDLHFNNIKSLPESIGNLTSLRKLNVSNNFSDFGPGGLPESMGGLDSLVELDLSSNQIRVLPDSVGRLENLKCIKLENNPLVIPPLKVVDHSMEAVMEYMAVRWSKVIPTEEEEILMGAPNEARTKHHGCVGVGGSWLGNLVKCARRDSPNVGKLLEWHAMSPSRVN